MKFCVLLLFLGLIEANKKLLGDMDQMVLGGKTATLLCTILNLVSTLEICSGGSQTGKCKRRNTWNFNPETRKCDKVAINAGECGFFLFKKKCKAYCRAVDPFNIKKRDPIKSDFD